jgi:FMN phosphatase YigB (HAD superfamily)
MEEKKIKNMTAEEMSQIITETVEETTKDVTEVAQKVNLAAQLAIRLLFAFGDMFEQVMSRGLMDKPTQAAFDRCLERMGIEAE